MSAAPACVCVEDCHDHVAVHRATDMRRCVAVTQIVHVTAEQEASYGVQEGDLLGNGMEDAIVGDGEIDWDCPCLQGMAQGVCGEQFKTAFSCFVTSAVEPKGSDCVEHFVAMRDCMIAHPQDYPDLANDAAADSATAGSDPSDTAAAAAPPSETEVSPPAALAVPA